MNYMIETMEYIKKTCDKRKMDKNTLMLKNKKTRTV